MNKVTITIVPCDAEGYKVLFRKLDSTDAYVTVPVSYDPGDDELIFTDSSYPDGTEYEGFVISICGVNYGTPQPFATAEIVTTWAGLNGSCETVASCSSGYTLSGDESICVKQDTVAATSSGSAGVAEAVHNLGWNRGGARVYQAGFPTNGEGTLDALLTTSPLWVNGTVPFDGNNDLIKGRMNAAAVWVVGGVPDNEYIGFSRKITVASAKTVYVAMAADNAFKFTLNGSVVVDCPTGNINGVLNFDYLQVYPVNLIAGDNFIEMLAANFGLGAGMVAEIYDNTLAELIAAAVLGDLTRLFSTADMVGEDFDLGDTVGYSCPVTYSYDTGSGLCVRVQTQNPIISNTGMLSYADRERLQNGNPDGYTEPNIDGMGIGPYIAPVENLDICPL